MEWIFYSLWNPIWTKTLLCHHILLAFKHLLKIFLLLSMKYDIIICDPFVIQKYNLIENAITSFPWKLELKVILQNLSLIILNYFRENWLFSQRNQSWKALVLKGSKFHLVFFFSNSAFFSQWNDEMLANNNFLFFFKEKFLCLTVL